MFGTLPKGCVSFTQNPQVRLRSPSLESGAAGTDQRWTVWVFLEH